MLVLSASLVNAQNYPFNVSGSSPHDNSFFKIDPLPTIPFNTGATTYHQLKFGENYIKSAGLCVGCNQNTRGIFYGGNLGVCQDINNYEAVLGKWSFKGAWTKPDNTSNYSPGTNYLVDYHRWGNYSAHFGLRTRSDVQLIDPETGLPLPENHVKDAVITWAYESGLEEERRNRLIFQSISGVHNNGAGTNHVATEWATILHNGNIGSGTSNPTAQFQLKSVSSTPIPLLELLDINNISLVKFTKNGEVHFGGLASTTNQQLLIDPNGKVFTGTVNTNDLNQVWLIGGNNFPSPINLKTIGTLGLTDLRFTAANQIAFHINGVNGNKLGFTEFYLPVSIGGRYSDDIVDPSLDWALTLKPIKTKFGSLSCLNHGNVKVFEVSDNIKINAPTQITGNTSITGITTGAGNVIIGLGATTSFNVNALSIFNGSALFSSIQTNEIESLGPATGQVGNGTNYFMEMTSAAFTKISDISLKTNINSVNSVLQKLLRLNPVSYNYKNEKLTRPVFGFIAQELDEIFPTIVLKPDAKNKCYRVNYDELIPLAIKGIQEQQVIIEEQKANLELITQKLDLVIRGNIIKENKNLDIQKEGLNELPLLFQNHPNPFNGFTFIDYFLPKNSNNAFLKVIDNNGKLVKAFPINQTGFGQVELDCHNLSSGTYHYTLLVDSQVMDTKTMIISSAD